MSINPTIIRFAKAYLDGGGVESFIDDLDNTLLKHHEMTIVRLYVTLEDNKVTEQRIGKGLLVQVPMRIISAQKHLSNDTQRYMQDIGAQISSIIREVIIYNPLLHRLLFKKIISRHYPKQYGAQIINAGQTIESVLKKYGGDLVIMHSIGSIDTQEMLNIIRQYKCPFIFHNNFSNQRLYNISIREQISGAACIAGVTGIGVPFRLKKQFVNLSSGINTDQYNPAVKTRITLHKRDKIIFYPARVTPLKGQADLLKAYGTIKKMGIESKVIIAGRIESQHYAEYLKKVAKDLAIDQDVTFLGPISREEVCEWYRKASVLAFPTYHPEGVPTIIMEAQAMQVPVVAYNIGGIPQAMINGQTGFYVPKGDLKSFIKKLVLLLSDNALREKLGEQGRNFIVKELSLEALALRHFTLYNSLIKKPHS